MITESQQVERIRIIAAADPDYIYNNNGLRGCTYLPNFQNTCGCIVGESLRDLGVPEELLAELDALARAGCSVAWGTPDTVRVLGEHVAVRALVSPWIRYVQVSQDAGESWSAAVRAADEVGRHEGWLAAEAAADVEAVS